MFQLTPGLGPSGAGPITLHRNTFGRLSEFLYAEGNHASWIMGGNILAFADYGILSAGREGRAALDACFRSSTITGNILAGYAPSPYPPGNSFPGSLAAVIKADGKQLPGLENMGAA